MEYYSDKRKNETLPFAITWIDLKGFMFSEISQTERQKLSCFYLYVESKKQNKQI